MGQFKVEAILLTVRDWDDVDRMVTLFSREYGKITAIAYGARRPKNQLAGTVQPFIHAEVTLLEGKSIATVRQSEVLRHFRELREDLDKMGYAAFLGELTGELWPEREADPQVFELLLNAYGLIATRNPRITALAGAFQLLALGGFKPETVNCLACGRLLAFPAYFDISGGGCRCAACGAPSLMEYTEEMNNFINKLLQLDWKEPGHFSVTGSVLMQTECLLAEYITFRLDKKLKALAFIAMVAHPRG